MDDAARGQNPLPFASKVARDCGGGGGREEAEGGGLLDVTIFHGKEEVSDESRQGEETHVFGRPIK